MLNELVKRLGATKADRRTANRIRKRYQMAWIKDGTPVAGTGLEISEKGLLFASRESPIGSEVDVALELRGRQVRARLKVVRLGSVARDGVEWAMIAAVFAGIAADDWDTVVRFCQNRGDPSNKASAELAARSGDDDAYRLLPLRIQERVVALLVEAGRLAPGSEAKNPLLRMSYSGTTPTGAHRLAVHSRRVTDDEVLQFDSMLTVDDSGKVSLDR
jgi:hypothetical protein